MSNKLYTEEEILSLLKIHLADEDQAESFLALLTPIELPSDEEIDEAMWANVEGQSIFFPDAFRMGSKWMRDKIQGGNK
jgi:hypothetical protein